MNLDFDGILAILFLFALGVAGGTARYMHYVSKHYKNFDWAIYLMHVTVGGVVAVFAGFVAEGMELSPPWTYALVGVAAISSREILDIVPMLFQSWVVSRVTIVPPKASTGAVVKGDDSDKGVSGNNDKG